MGNAATPIRAERLARHGMAKFENEKLPVQPRSCLILMRCQRVSPSASPMAGSSGASATPQRFDSITAALEILG